MRKSVSVAVSLALISVFTWSLMGCGADIKAENEKLKVENTNLKAEVDKLNLESQTLKNELQKAVEKDATISSLTAENEGLKKQVEDLKAQITKLTKKTKATTTKKKK